MTNGRTSDLFYFKISITLVNCVDLAMLPCLTSPVQELQPLGESLDQLAERDLSSPGPLSSHPGVSSHAGPLSSHSGISSHPGVSSQQGFNIQLDRELQDVQLEVTE